MAQKYKLLYCARINDEKHEGLLKVGDTEFVPTKDLSLYQPNDVELQKAAKARIKGWSGTAAAGAELVYCEALIRYNPKSRNKETFVDKDVHRVLRNSGNPSITFDSDLDSGREWYKVLLPVVKAAIKACQEFRDYLHASEVEEQTIYDLREEQAGAVKAATSCFKSQEKMLWHAKMRFGKTIAALNLVKQQGYKRTLIITHRPVVEDSWGSDFYHVFGKEDRAVFLTKIRDAEPIFDDDETDGAIDEENDQRLRKIYESGTQFVYFASIQDLRGSQCVKDSLKKHHPNFWPIHQEPKAFNKNKIVFEIDWDLVVVDEAHEGTRTALGQEVLHMLIKRDKKGKTHTKKLDLSGTAFNLLDEYADGRNVFTWDYVMEQEAKASWPERYPDKENPYADMPQMHIRTIDLAKAIAKENIRLDKDYFSFREFFRPWQNDRSRDRQDIPAGRTVGDFVYAEAINKFLEMLTSDATSNYPYATEENLKRNAHSFWVIPGVKEAAALSRVLQAHSFFKERNFGIVNVAGDGDPNDLRANYDALTKVRKAIEKHPYTITLSCGRLTTGVTVKEWSAVFMLAGSEETDAKGYMQTIFRAQSAGKVNGVQKTDAYVYDFAPDRTLRVLAASILKSRYSGKEGFNLIDEQLPVVAKFLEFCPVVAIDGAEFKPFDVHALVSQINRVQIDRALRTGFMDDGIYNESMIRSMAQSDTKAINKIFQKLRQTSHLGQLTNAGVKKNGIHGADHTQSGSTVTHPGASGAKDKEKKKEEKKYVEDVISRLRTISIRIPLLFFGGNFEIEDGKLSEIITGIDQDSWEVFMPKGLTKAEFKKLVKYYNQATVLGAGKIIRSKALAADALPPTERVIAITNLFSHFHNPAKETVLTPWRVVNMHLSTDLGGWCFYNEAFEEHNDEFYKRLLEPRWVNRGAVTAATVNNPDATILELNSKTGLYPLYMVYNLYRAKLGDFKESEFFPEELNAFWDEAVKQVYVLCQTSMAKDITLRTLVGYRAVETNIKYDGKLLNNLMENMEVCARKILTGKYWNKEGDKMKFDAVVGNPPYQLETAKTVSKTNGQASRKSIFQYFQMVADRVATGATSLIYPGGRWIHRSGKGMAEFGLAQINDPRLVQVDFYPNSQDIFQNVDIGDGVSIVYKDMNKTTPGFKYVYHANQTAVCMDMEAPGEALLTLNPYDTAIVQKIVNFVDSNRLSYLHDRILSRALFGIESDFVEKNPDKVRACEDAGRVPETLREGEIALFTNDKAGKAGRAKWFIADRSVIEESVSLIDEWQVVVSSANAGGQKRDSQLMIVDNRSAFGRTRVALGTFKTEEEAKHFYKYCKSYLVRFMFLMTDESLTSLGKQVPDVMDYTSECQWIDFTQEVNKQLYQAVGLTPEEIEHVESRIKELDRARSIAQA